MHHPFSFKLSGLLMAGAAFVALMPSLANAQDSSSADAGRFSETLRPQLEIPQATPDISVKSATLLGAPTGAEKITLKFGGLKVTGNSVYSESEISALYQGLIGQTITLADVYKIANDITLKYRDDGFILTQVIIPPQTIEQGLPRIQIVEGRIDQITVQADGQSERETSLIRQYAAQIKSSGPLNVVDVERQLLLINDLPGVTARSVISPSTTAGAANMLIIVERDPFEGLVSLDNLSSKYLGRWTLGGVATANSLLGLNEAISAQIAYAPGSSYELAYGGLSYEQPIGIYGTRIGGLVSSTQTDPGFDLKQFDVNGHANLYSLYVRHPFIRSRNTNLIGRMTFDIRDVKSSNNVEATRHDHIRALRANVRFDTLETLLGVAVDSVNLQVSKGLDILGASDKGDFTSRPNGDPQFTKVELQIQRLQRVTSSVNLLFTGRAQKANGAVLSSEEFGVGGASSGRGYDPSEITGDDGIAGQAEVQWNNPFTLPAAGYIENVQFYGFADAGTVWNDDATTSSDKRDSLFSTGIGTRIDVARDVKLDLGVAFPMTKEIATEGDRDPRYYLSVQKRF